jgi:protein-disulfide isomerase
MAELKIPVDAIDHIRGDIKAPMILVEYGDYECPHCGHAFPIVKRVEKHFGKQLGFVFRNFPLKEIHPNAEVAAETAEFAGANGKFWEMHDAIFRNQVSLSVPMLMEVTQTLKLSAQALTKSLENREFEARVGNDFAGGVRSGVNGTPTFFINGQRYEGSPEFEELVAAIEGGL